MSGHWRIGAALAVACALCLSACRRRPAPSRGAPAASAALSGSVYPMQVQDDLGRAVRVPVCPRRILSLLPSFTETLFALGVGDRVVGVDDYSDYPTAAQGLPKLGGLYDTQVERALALQPDLVLLSENSTAIAHLAGGNTAVWAGSARHFEDVFRVIELTGKLVDRSGEAAALVARMRSEIASVEVSVRGLAPTSVYYELDPAPYSVGPDSFIGVLLTKAGGANIVPPGLGDFPKLNPELVVSRNPSLIIGASLADVARRPGWAGIAAVRSGRVFQWSGPEAHLVSRPGPRLPEGLRALAKRLHPTP